jgi:hypothetical protein
LLAEPVKLNEEVDEPLIVPVPDSAPAILKLLPFKDITAPLCISKSVIEDVADKLGKALTQVEVAGITTTSELVGTAEAIAYPLVLE